MAITPVSLYSDDYTTLNSINSLRASTFGDTKVNDGQGSSSFDKILGAFVDMYKEADSLQKAAESSEMSFALGYTDNIHDVALAQKKASISLQYTAKVTNAFVSAYKELMNMQL